MYIQLMRTVQLPALKNNNLMGGILFPPAKNDLDGQNPSHKQYPKEHLEPTSNLT